MHPALSLIALYQCIKFHLTPLYTLRHTLRTSFLLQKLKKGSHSVNIIGRVMILELCTFADDPLSLSQVSFNSLMYFQRYARDKLFVAKMKKGSNCVNTVGRVVILALCYFPHCPLSVFQVSLNYLQYV